MVERSLRARTRALHVREHGWWRATHVADHGWTRAHEEASRHVDCATERITQMKEKISPIIEERDTLRKEYCLVEERIATHKKGADTLRKLLQESVNMVEARAEKLEKGRSRVRELENETKVLEERNSRELATIKEEIEILSMKSSDLEKEWIESHETNQKQSEDQLCELQSVNKECVETCHELVKLDSENSQIRCNIQKNKDRSHKCRPDLARDIKMLQQLQQELEEILTDSQDQGDKHGNRSQTKMLPRQCDGSIDFTMFLECLTRTLESSLDKSIVDKGDTIPCDLLKSVVDNVEISEDNTVFLKTFLKCLLAKDMYGSIEKCLEENGVENNSNTDSNNKPENLFCECPFENQTKYNNTNEYAKADQPNNETKCNEIKYATTNQPNDVTVMQINNKFCIANKCRAENLTQNGDKISTCCLNMDTIYVIPIKEYDKDGNFKQEKLERSIEVGPNTEKESMGDFKNRKTSSNEIPLKCIEYEDTCSSCGIDRSISNRNSDVEMKKNTNLEGNNESARLLNQILEEKCNTKIGDPHNKTEKSLGDQNSQSAEPNIKQIYILPTCSENFEKLGTPTPISSIDLSPVHIVQRLSSCPYCLEQSKSKELSKDICKDTKYASDFINMVVLNETRKNNEKRRTASEFQGRKSQTSNSTSKNLIAECLQGEPCLQYSVLQSSENILECNDVNEEINTVDTNTQCEECLPEKQSEETGLERCFEKLLQEINLPKFLDNLLIAIGRRNEVGCLCDIEPKTSLNNTNGKTNLCYCDAKECLCELKLTKLDDCQCRVVESKISLKVSSNIRETKQIASKPSNVSCLCDKPSKVCTCEQKSSDIDKCECQEIVKLTTKIPSSLRTQDVSCLCDKPLDLCMCRYESAEIDDCKCQETVKLSSKLTNNLEEQDVSCLCDKPLDLCMCKYESTEIVDCECQETETKLSFKLSTNACSTNSTENLKISPRQSSKITCLCEKPLDQCTCHENTLHPLLAKLSGNITAKALSNLCVCDKCQNIHLNLLKKLVKCASESQDNICFADEILKEIGSFAEVCNVCGKPSEECDCERNVDEINGTPRRIRSMTTNTSGNENVETCTSYCLPIEAEISESKLKLQSNISDLNTGLTFITPQNSASKLVLHSKVSNLGLDTDTRIKSSNSVTFGSSENIENLENNNTQIISCKCFEDKHQKDVKTSVTSCNSEQKNRVIDTSEKLTSTSKVTCQYVEKSNQVSSNTSNICYSNNLTNDEIIKLFLQGTNLKPDDLRKALNETLCRLKNSSECMDETENQKKFCIRVEPRTQERCTGEVRNVIDKQCSPYKKDATNSISGMRFPCTTNDASTSQQNISLPCPIEFPSCEVLSNKHESPKNTCVAPKKQCANKLSSSEQPQNIRNKPVAPNKRPASKFPCSETPTSKNISTYPKQRSPSICPGYQKQTLLNKPATARKYLPNACPAFDTTANSRKRNSINNPELPGLKRQNSQSNLSCGCIEEAIKFTDYTQGDKISVGCSARNSPSKCVPTKRNTINSQVPSNIYPSTPYSSVATCYNDIDEIPTRLSNYESKIDTNRSKTCYKEYKTSLNNNLLPEVDSPESYCSRSTSCSILPNSTRAHEKAGLHTITCKCSKDAKYKPTPTYCEKSTCDAMTDTDKPENMNKLNSYVHKGIELSAIEPCHCKNRDKPNQRDEQNEITESKCSKSTCISSSKLNSEMNNSFSNEDNAHTVTCKCVKDAICKCEGRQEVSPYEMAQKTTKITCQDSTNMSNKTCRKRKKSMYNQSERTQQTSCDKFKEFAKSKDHAKGFPDTNKSDGSNHCSNEFLPIVENNEPCLFKERKNSSIHPSDVEISDKMKCMDVSNLPPDHMNNDIKLSTDSKTQNNLSERNLVSFCSVETCAAKSNVENTSQVQTESNIWKKRYVVIKPKTKSNLSCNRNTCLPLSNKEDKVLVQVPNTGSSLFVSSNEINEIPKIYDEIAGKQCNICKPKEKEEEISKEKEESNETLDTQKENDETSQTQIENAETSQTQIENAETSQTQIETAETSQTQIENDEKSQTQMKNDVKRQTQEENEESETQVKNNGICGIQQKYGRLCRTAVKKYEIMSKTQFGNNCPLSCSWSKKKNNFKCKKPQKYSETCCTQEKNDRKSKMQEKQNDKFSDLEKCLEECLGKRKNKCNCSL